MHNIETIFLLLLFVSVLAVFSHKINFPFPILLVLAGLAISLVPGLPVIELKPEIVFLLFLPPLLYSAAWNTSWKDFKANLRPISLAAIGLVLFTTCLVAWVAHTYLPGFGWPEAFLLGAIVAPPDAAAATSVTKGLGLHPRTITIIEGESLLNDASALIAYKYALAALATGNFILWKAGVDFVWVSAAGIVIGLIVGYILYLVHKFIVDDPVMETVLTLLTPFLSYILAEHLHVSGVLAVVVAGLFLSSKSSKIFSHFTRLQAVSVWKTVIFILEGMVFILIGLQLRQVIVTIQDYEITQLIVYGLGISFVVMLLRFIWVFPAAYLPRWLSKKIREREKTFSYKYVIIFSWAGMRGVVSIAAAMAIPLTLASGTVFPNRDIILFLTFSVVIFTLVFQGLTLPWVIKWLNVKPYSSVEEENIIRRRVASAAIVYIEENLSMGELTEDILARIKTKYELRIDKLSQTEIVLDNGAVHNQADRIFHLFNTAQINLIKTEREVLEKLRNDGSVNEEVLRKLEYELDLEEARLMLERHS
ncbi:MAG: Na+/H+ antiporter [Cytophagales bacterium]|nr:Na+/H+ antiporter [Cytophagales bacterium]